MGWFLPLLAGTAAQGLTNAATAAINTRRQYKYAMRLAEAEFLRNYQMWQEMNAYNHPRAQMERLAEAGLNPALVYGSGATTLAASSPQYSLDKNVVSDIEPPQLMLYYDIKQRQKQLEYLDAQVAQQRALAKRAEVEADIASETKLDAINRIQEESRTSTYTRMQQELQGVIAHHLSSDENIQKIVRSQLYGYQRNEVEYEQALANVNATIASTALTKIQYELAKNNKTLSDIDLELYTKYGLRPGDPTYLRMLFQVLRENGVDPTEIIKGIIKVGKFARDIITWWLPNK